MKKILRFALAAFTGVLFSTSSNAQCHNGVVLDGVNEFLYTPFNDYNFTNFTIEAWIKVPNYTTNVHYVSLYQNAYLVLGDYGSGNIETWADGLSPIAMNVPATPPVDTWLHLAFTFDGSNQKMYFNGVLADTDPTSGAVTLSTSFNQGLVIGARYTQNTQFVAGSVSDVRIWTVARTASEISTNMNATLTGSETGLVAYYDFTDGPGSTIVTDKTGNGNTLTLNNMEPATDWITSGSVTGTDIVSNCGSYTWINGTTYTSSNNTATHIITGGAANGCDSIVTLDLTINSNSNGIDQQSACSSYTWIDGNTYTSSNNSAIHTISGGAANGCDSIVTLNLTINNISNTTVNLTNNVVLTASNSSATYQWIDCNNGNAPISGATSQSFTATANGSYAVILTENGCSDTSACASVTSVGLEELGHYEISVSPNPSNGHFTLDLGELTADVVEIYNLQGQVVSSIKNVQQHNYDLNVAPGVYILRIQSAGAQGEIKLIVK